MIISPCNTVYMLCPHVTHLCVWVLSIKSCESCDKVCQWLATGWWFSPGTPVSSTNKTDRHNIAEILLKVVLNTITLTLNCLGNINLCFQYENLKGGLDFLFLIHMYEMYTFFGLDKFKSDLISIWNKWNTFLIDLFNIVIIFSTIRMMDAKNRPWELE